MPEAADWQCEFANALLELNLPAPSFAIDPTGQPSSRRFGIYRNNILRGLIEALKDMYPATARIVGEEFFEAMAREFVLVHPPHTPVLLEYGGGFADFVETFEPAAELPYLGDVCRIERAWLEAYHAAECEALDQNELRSIQSTDASQLRFLFHPSTRLLASRFPALTIWSTNIDDEIPVPVDIYDGGENILIVRPEANVEVRALTHSKMEFIASLFEGHTLSYAAARAMKLNPEFPLSSALSNLIQTGILVGFRRGASLKGSEG